MTEKDGMNWEDSMDRPDELFSTTSARNSWRRRDPETSCAAARSQTVAKLNRLQRLIQSTFQLARRSLTDEELVAELHRHFPTARYADSSVRSRRKDLVRQGRIIDTGDRRETVHGSQATVWQLVDDNTEEESA